MNRSNSNNLDKKPTDTTNNETSGKSSEISDDVEAISDELKNLHIGSVESEQPASPKKMEEPAKPIDSKNIVFIKNPISVQKGDSILQKYVFLRKGETLVKKGKDVIEEARKKVIEEACKEMKEKNLAENQSLQNIETFDNQGNTVDTLKAVDTVETLFINKHIIEEVTNQIIARRDTSSDLAASLFGEGVAPQPEQIETESIGDDGAILGLINTPSLEEVADSVSVEEIFVGNPEVFAAQSEDFTINYGIGNLSKCSTNEMARSFNESDSPPVEKESTEDLPKFTTDKLSRALHELAESLIREQPQMKMSADETNATPKKEDALALDKKEGKVEVPKKRRVVLCANLPFVSKEEMMRECKERKEAEKKAKEEALQKEQDEEEEKLAEDEEKNTKEKLD